MECVARKETTKPPEYRVWVGIRQRCNDANTPCYDRYGGRGVSVCSRWESFDAFLADVGPRPSSNHSIERIDNAGNYDPDNCRWATRTEQQRNKRGATNITALGTTRHICEWATDLGVTVGAIRYRLREGWTVEDAVSIPRGKGPNGFGRKARQST